MYNRQREKKADDFFFLVSKVKTRLSFCCPNKNGMNSFLVHRRRENDRTVLVNRIKENKKKRMNDFCFWPSEKVSWLFANYRIQMKIKVWSNYFIFFSIVSIDDFTGLGWNSQIDWLETFNAWCKSSLILHFNWHRKW